MSSGAFVIETYQARYGGGAITHPIQVQPETVTLVIAGTPNLGASGDPVSPISARVSGGRNQIGLNAELVRLKFVDTPEGYKPDGVITLPLLASAIRVKATRGATGTYQGVGIVVLGVSPETVR